MASRTAPPNAAPAPKDATGRKVPDPLGEIMTGIGRMAALTELANRGFADIGMAWGQAAVATQAEIAAMSRAAMMTGDPVALATLPPRAFRAILHQATACSSTTLQAAQSLGKTLFRIDRPASGDPIKGS